MSIGARQRHASSIAELLIGQQQAVVDWLDPLTADEFRRPTSLPRWTVRHVVGHLLSKQHELTEALDRPSTHRPLTLDHYLRRRRIRGSQDLAAAASVCGDGDNAQLRSQLAAGISDLRAADLSDRVVDHQHDPVRVVDLLRVSLARWVVYSGDLQQALPHRGSIPTPRAALADSVRMLTEVISREHPGKAIELRVPPFTAVQLGIVGATAQRVTQGPSHTRGTPPNLVEMRPETFLRLAGGRSSWDAECTAGQVSASGAHADLRHIWPLVH